MCRLVSPEPKSSNNIFSFILIVISCFACAGLSFMAYFTSPSPCSSSTILPLSSWIFGSAIVYCIIPLFYISIFATSSTIGAFLYFSFLFFLYFPFNISWSIVGSIVLFRDSSYCREIYPNLWYISLSVLVYCWISILSILWEGKNKITS